MTYKERQELKSLSLLAFGRSGRYKSIMKRGRKVKAKDGSYMYTLPITPQEIKDTMTYIIVEREKNQNRIEEEIQNERLRTKENDERASEGTQQSGSDETIGESEETAG